MRSILEMITWDFEVSAEGNRVRYGRIGNHFYKQFLPGGIEVPQIHPVKEIDQRLYEFANRRRKAS